MYSESREREKLLLARNGAAAQSALADEYDGEGDELTIRKIFFGDFIIQRSFPRVIRRCTFRRCGGGLEPIGLLFKSLFLSSEVDSLAPSFSFDAANMVVFFTALFAELLNEMDISAWKNTKIVLETYNKIKKLASNESIWILQS
uniref:Uncharacterized protein n=1 Tax=Romanomermis culicivorax TaxID=13658 RepID=A0A915KUR4_ROMCU